MCGKAVFARVSSVGQASPLRSVLHLHGDAPHQIGVKADGDLPIELFECPARANRAPAPSPGGSLEVGTRSVFGSVGHVKKPRNCRQIPIASRLPQIVDEGVDRGPEG